MNIMTEIVKMKTVEGVTPEDFMKTVNKLELEFHLKQEGYVDTELLFDEKEDVWIMVQHWETLEDLKNASGKMFKENCTEAFRNAIDPKNIEIRVYPQLQTWHRK